MPVEASANSATNRTLLALLENQVQRTDAALDRLDVRTYATQPGKDCNSIQGICRHLVALRRFQLSLLESPLVARVELPEQDEPLDSLREKLDRATVLVREALEEHDPEDWYRTPGRPRDGKWGDEPTMMRFARPFNDFTNHLGSIRAIRRLLGDPSERVQ